MATLCIPFDQKMQQHMKSEFSSKYSTPCVFCNVSSSPIIYFVFIVAKGYKHVFEKYT